MTGPRPQRNAAAAAAYALLMVGRGTYRWGTGNNLTKGDDERDCWGFAYCECFGVPRHRPGYNKGWRDADGRTPSVEDDINCNSGIEDADHAMDLFRRVRVPMIGDIMAYPTIHIAGELAYGHGKIVVGLNRLGSVVWDPNKPDWSLLDTVECHGPNGRHPAIVFGNGAGMNERDRRARDPRDRTALIRVRP